MIEANEGHIKIEGNEEDLFSDLIMICGYLNDYVFHDSKNYDINLFINKFKECCKTAAKILENLNTLEERLLIK